MYQDSYAEVYELVMRHRDRDYAAEAAAIGRLVRERCPGASSLLDVACGTGLHLRYLHEMFGRVCGLDASADMLALARARISGLQCYQGDMRVPRLDATFDAITCMFAVPHLESPAELEATVAGLARHLTAGGVLVLEPWYRPEQFVTGYVATDVVRDGQRRSTVRLSHSTLLSGTHDRVRMVVHYADAAGETGIRCATETVDLSLFTDAQFKNAFARAGCDAEYVAGEPFTWGLWIGHRPSGGQSEAEVEEA